MLNNISTFRSIIEDVLFDLFSILSVVFFGAIFLIAVFFVCARLPKKKELLKNTVDAEWEEQLKELCELLKIFPSTEIAFALRLDANLPLNLSLKGSTASTQKRFQDLYDTVTYVLYRCDGGVGAVLEWARTASMLPLLRTDTSRWKLRPSQTPFEFFRENAKNSHVAKLIMDDADTFIALYNAT